MILVPLVRAMSQRRHGSEAARKASRLRPPCRRIAFSALGPIFRPVPASSRLLAGIRSKACTVKPLIVFAAPTKRLPATPVPIMPILMPAHEGEAEKRNEGEDLDASQRYEKSPA